MIRMIFKYDAIFYKKVSGNSNICFLRHIIFHEITWRSRILSSSMVATSYRKVFKFKMIKIIKLKVQLLSCISHISSIE